MMYWAIEHTKIDRNLNCFVQRSSQNDMLRDYRMTRITFGVCASSFAANMSVTQNAMDHTHDYSMATKAVEESFYVDDALTGTDSIEEAIRLQMQLHDLLSCERFLLRKGNCSDPTVLDNILFELRDKHEIQSTTYKKRKTKTLWFEWNTHSDQFNLTIADLPSLNSVTKRALASDIAKTFEDLGMFCH